MLGTPPLAPFAFAGWFFGRLISEILKRRYLRKKEREKIMRAEEIRDALARGGQSMAGGGGVSHGPLRPWLDAARKSRMG